MRELVGREVTLTVWADEHPPRGITSDPLKIVTLLEETDTGMLFELAKLYEELGRLALTLETLLWEFVEHAVTVALVAPAGITAE